MSHYVTEFQGRIGSEGADDEVHAGRRVVMGLLVEGSIQRGASYEVRVAPVANPLRPIAELKAALADAGRVVIVDVALEPGRGSVVGRLA